MEERLIRVLRGVVYRLKKKDRAQNRALWHFENERFRRREMTEMETADVRDDR